MSNKLTGRVWELQMGHAELIVLQALCDNAHDDGTHCYPSVAYLAWKTNYSERQVQRVLRDLEALRLIETFRVKTRKGTFQHYRIRLENGTPKPPFQRGDILSAAFSTGGDILSDPGDILSQVGDILSDSHDNMSPKPLVEPQENPKKERNAPSSDIRQELPSENVRAMLAVARAEIRAQMGRK